MHLLHSVEWHCCQYFIASILRPELLNLIWLVPHGASLIFADGACWNGPNQEGKVVSFKSPTHSDKRLSGQLRYLHTLKTRQTRLQVRSTDPIDWNFVIIWCSPAPLLTSTILAFIASLKNNFILWKPSPFTSSSRWILIYRRWDDTVKLLMPQ